MFCLLSYSHHLHGRLLLPRQHVQKRLAFFFEINDWHLVALRKVLSFCNVASLCKVSCSSFWMLHPPSHWSEIHTCFSVRHQIKLSFHTPARLLTWIELLVDRIKPSTLLLLGFARLSPRWDWGLHCWTEATGACPRAGELDRSTKGRCVGSSFDGNNGIAWIVVVEA